MTEQEKLKHEIDELREIVRQNWVDTDRLTMTRDERQGLRQNINLCIHDLKGLLQRLEVFDARGP